MKSSLSFRLTLILIVLFSFYSCKRDPLKLKYSPEKFGNDTISLKEVLTVHQYEKLISAIDSLPQEDVTGRQYGEIAGITNTSVMNRFSKRYLKKNKLTKKREKMSE